MALFACDVTIARVPIDWFFNGEKIQTGPETEIRSEAKHHELIFSNLQLEQVGEVKAQLKDAVTTAQLTVERLFGEKYKTNR